MNLPRALLLVLALLQAGGILDVVRRNACAADCERAGCNDCAADEDAPLCPCHCPGAPSLAGPAITVATLAPPRGATAHSFERADGDPTSPDPREILHVPRQRTV